MRTNKFRAWDKDRKYMDEIGDLYWFEENGVRDWDGSGHYADWVIMQSIGKTDIKGKDIYEGDIVRQFADCDKLGNDLYFRYLIRWNEDNMCFEGVNITNKGIDESDTYWGSDLTDLEVIGNMFENPELLNTTEVIGYADKSGLMSAT